MAVSPGKQTVPRAELMAPVLRAENINIAGVFEVRVGAQHRFKGSRSKASVATVLRCV